MRIVTEFGPDGATLMRTVDDNGDGTATITVYPSGATTVYTMAVPQPEPLERAAALAALLACLDVVSVEDAANSVGVTVAALTNEVLAWSLGTNP